MIDRPAPQHLSNPADAVEHVLSRVGKRIVLGLPLGIGKANHVANALYERAVADPSIDLTIFSALTLGVPPRADDLESRFVVPLLERLCGSYPAFRYAGDQARGALAENIRVHEFFLPAGRYLGSGPIQQGYLSSNYTHVLRDLFDAGLNVMAQLVARRGEGPEARYSLASNTDLTLDALPLLEKRAARGQPFALIGQVNEQMPFMPGAAALPAAQFTALLDTPGTQFDLFSIPKQPVPLTDYATALHVAGLIADGGTLQIGIGTFADALTHALVLRHRATTMFTDLRARLQIRYGTQDPAGLASLAGLAGESTPFEQGLYASTEMLVEGLLHLMDAGVLKRPANAYVDAASTPGPLIHAGFFLGSKSFYARLRDMAEDEIARIAMTPISFVNDLFGNEEIKRVQRRDARFVNNAMMVTALGAVVSDALEDGRVISGVGGQYNFVAQAHELAGARSIITVNATRQSRGRVTSNIVWNYGHTTIPRHLRDIVVSEYGIADLRGKSDRDCVVAMLAITDARFQDALLAEAKKAGKVERGYTIPNAVRANRPEHIEHALQPARAAGHLPDLPLGTDMTDTEVRLVHALARLKAIAHSKPRLMANAFQAWRRGGLADDERAALARMELASPDGFKDNLLRYALLWALRQS